jgi:transcriptional regulator of heat shock response
MGWSKDSYYYTSMEILRHQLQKEREELDEIMNDIQNKQDILKREKDQMEKIRVEVQREKDTEGY